MNRFHYLIKHGHGIGEVRDQEGKHVFLLYEGFRSPIDGCKFANPTPSAFSFNSPVGACPSCKGFGRIIEINPELVIPDPKLSIKMRRLKHFQEKSTGIVKQNSLGHVEENRISDHQFLGKPPKNEQQFIWNGDPDYEDGNQKWYGINGFFKWVTKKAYKMHVRVFLSKYRGYFECPACKGDRLKEESRFWKWKSYSLPELYRLSIDDLFKLISTAKAFGGPKD